MRIGALIFGTLTIGAFCTAHVSFLVFLAHGVGKSFKPFDRALLTSDLFLIPIFAIGIVISGFIATSTKKKAALAAWASLMLMISVLYLGYGVFFTLRMRQAINCRTFAKAAREFINDDHINDGPPDVVTHKQIVSII